MPQLDFTTYVSQVFWLLFFFVLFYLIMLFYVLPTLSLVIAVRKEKLESFQNQVSEFGGEKEEQERQNQAILLKSFTHSKEIMTHLNDYSNKWLNENIIELNQTTLLEANEKYLNSIGKLIAQKYTISKII